MTVKTVPTPPDTAEMMAPVTIVFPMAGPKICATVPDSNSPSSFDVPMNRLLTAETRPRLSSGVKIRR